MFFILIFLFLVLFVVVFMGLFNFLISFKEESVMKVTSFESGFVGVGLIQNSFSIHFFVMMLMFVIFDVEVVMFLGILVSDVASLVSFLLLFVFIVLGFYLEWWYGKLVWIV